MIRRIILLLIVFLFSAVPAFGALDLELPDHAVNGQAFVVSVTSDSSSPVTLQWNKKEVFVSCEKNGKSYSGVALLALPRDYDKKNVQIKAVARGADGTNTLVRTLPVKFKKYREQHLKVNKKYVELSKKDLDRHYGERADVRRMMSSLSTTRMWSPELARPVPGGLSSEFGVQRFFNGKPRQPHSGIDLRGKTGTPIKACADGVIRIASEHFFSGNSIYIDHGQGVVSMYFHLSKILVRDGESVKKGQVIGNVGATGRVTGPHLHFGLNVSGVAVDPMPLFSGK